MHAISNLIGSEAAALSLVIAYECMAIQRKCNHRCLTNALSDRIIVVQKAQRTGNMALHSFLCALVIGY